MRRVHWYVFRDGRVHPIRIPIEEQVIEALAGQRGELNRQASWTVLIRRLGEVCDRAT